jgi:hypothetical protein
MSWPRGSYLRIQKRSGYKRMDENYPVNEEDKHRENIQNWMLSIIRDGGIRRYDDLHVDAIDKSWSDKSKWVAAGFQALKVAIALRDSLRIDFSVVLGFSLDPMAAGCGARYQDEKILEENLNWMPPSLYLFERGREPWTEIEVPIPNVDKVIVDRSQEASRPWIKYWSYMEFQRDNEPLRSVFVAG